MKDHGTVPAAREAKGDPRIRPVAGRRRTDIAHRCTGILRMNRNFRHGCRSAPSSEISRHKIVVPSCAAHARHAKYITGEIQNVNDRSTQSGLTFCFMMAAIGSESVEK